MNSSRLQVRIRSCESADAEEALRNFFDAIMVIASADPTPEQIAAWARPDSRNIVEWDRARESYVFRTIAAHAPGLEHEDYLLYPQCAVSS